MTEVTYELIEECDPEFLAVIDGLTAATGRGLKMDRVVLYRGEGVVAEVGEHPLVRDKRLGRIIMKPGREIPWPDTRAEVAAMHAELADIKARTDEAWRQQKAVRAKAKQVQRIRK